MAQQHNIGIKLTADASGVQAGVRQAGDSLRQLGQHADGASTGADRLSQALGRVAHYGLAAGGLLALKSTVMSTGQALFEASARAQNLATQLNFATGGNSAREMAFITGLADKLGLQLQSTAKAYAGFSAAARGTALEGAPVRGVFEAIAKASAVMGLSADESSGALLAVQQMMSKGTVSAEEFRGQLGERMPIALQAGAQALGVTTAEFSKLLETGQIVAQDFLPKFASAINSMLGDSADQAAGRLEGAVNRMGTAWDKLKTAVGDSGVSQAVAGGMSAVTHDMNAFSEAMEGARVRGSGFVGQLNQGLGVLIGRAVGLNYLSDAFRSSAERAAHLASELPKAEKRLAELQARGAANTPNIYLKSAYYDAYKYAEELRAAKRAQDALRGQAIGGGRGTINPETVGDINAREAKADAALAAARRDLYGIKDNYETKLKGLNDLYTSGAMPLEEYRAAVAKLADENHKAGKSADGAARSQSTLQNAYQTFLVSVRQKIDTQNAEAASGAKLSEAERERISLQRALSTTLKGLAPAQRAVIEAEIERLALAERDKNAAAATLKAAQALQDARDKEAMASAQAIQGINDKAQALEDEIAVYGQGAAAIAAQTIERLEEKKAILSGFGASAEVIARIDEEIAARQRLAAASDTKTGLDDAAKENKRALDELNNYLDPAKASSFGDALKGAFEGAGNALAGLVNSLDSYSQKEAEIAKMRANLSAVSDPAERAQKEIALANLSSKAQINAYASMAGAAKGFFRQGSTGYKTMDAAEKAFRVAELARSTYNTAVKLGLLGAEVAATTAGQGAITAVSNAGEAARMPAKVTGIFASFMSMLGPWGVPAAIAAMAAVGIAAAGGGGGNALPKTNDGTGTVFGDASAKSESITKTIDLLQDIAKFGGIENNYAAKMLTSLRSIETKIGGFTNVILRSGGIELSGAGINEGSRVSPLFSTGNSSLDKFQAKLFGSSTKITGQGVYAHDATLAQIAAGGLDAGYYTDVNKKKKFLGLTYSDKNSSNFTHDNEVSRQIGGLLTSFADSVKLAGPILGASLDDIDGRLNSFVVKIGRIDLKGLSGKEIQEKLNAVFGAAGDDIARAAMPGLEHLQQVGEGYFETLARVASTLSGVNQIFDTLGSTLYDSSIAGAEASIALAELFGGLEKMADATGRYYENFYSEGERRAITQRQLQKAFDGLGLKMPDIDSADARKQFRDIAEAQDLTTESGRKTWAAMMGLSDAFASVTQDAASATVSVESVAQQLGKAFGITGETISSILLDAVKNAESAGEAQRMAAQAFEDEFYGNALSSLTDSLGSMLQSSVIGPLMESLVAGSAASSAALAAGGAMAASAMAAGGVAGASAAAAGGGMAAGAMAAGGASAANSMVAGGNAVGALMDVALEEARVKINIYTQILSDPAVQSGIKDISKLMGEVAGLTFNANQSWGGGGGGSFSGSAGNANQAADKLSDALTKLGETMASEVKRLRGLLVDDAPNTRDVLMARFATSTAAARAGDMKAAELLPELSKSLDAATASSALNAVELARMRNWLAGSLEETAKIAGIKLPALATGTNYVPRDMLAMIHEGEAVVPKAFNPFAGGGAGQGGDDGETRAFHGSFRQFSGAQLEASANMQRLLLRVARVLEQWDAGGMPQDRAEVWSPA